MQEAEETSYPCPWWPGLLSIKVCPAAVSRSETIVPFAEHMRERWRCMHQVRPWTLCTRRLGTIAEENWLRKRAGLQEDDFLLLLTCGLRPVKDPLFLVGEILEWNSLSEGASRRRGTSARFGMASFSNRLDCRSCDNLYSSGEPLVAPSGGGRVDIVINTSMLKACHAPLWRP